MIPTLCGSAFKNKGVQRTLDAVIDFLPSPLDIGAVQGFDCSNQDNIMERKPLDEEPFSALAFKIMTDPYVGRLTFFRVYSGVVSTGDHIFNPNIGKNNSQFPIWPVTAMQPLPSLKTSSNRAR